MSANPSPPDFFDSPLSLCSSSVSLKNDSLSSLDSAIVPSQPSRTRSRACLHCRRRKMKCDGERPSCAPCNRAERGSECEYDDGKPSRVRDLYNELDRLERRLKELESIRKSPERTSPPRGSDSSASSATAVDIVPSFPQQLIDGLYDMTTLQGSPTYMSDASVAAAASIDMDNLLLDYHASVEAEPHNMLAWSNTDDPPIALAQYLINIFLPHAQQCGLSVNPERFASSLLLPSAAHGAHTALKNAVWLWGCHFSGDKGMEAYKPALTQRTVDSLPDLLQQPDRIVEAVQTTCLLTTYLFAHGRMVEGAYHVNASALLAMGAGLHRLVPPGCESQHTAGAGMGSLELPPARDGIQWAERLLTFWNVYVLERSWSAASGLASPRWGRQESRTTITSPWPRDFDTYSAEFPMPPDTGYSPSVSHVLDFDAGRDLRATNSKAEMRAKSAALFECAARISETRDPRLPITEAYRQRFLSVQSTAYAFCISLPQLIPHGQRASSFTDCTLFTTHAMTHAAIIRMHYALAIESMASHSKCVAAAQAIAATISYLGRDDFMFLEPVVGSCWTLAGLVIIRHIERLSSMSSTADKANTMAALDTIVTALNQLGLVFPLAASQASKIDAIRWR